MRCKPGDLAIIIKGPHSGIVVEVVRLDQWLDGRICWRVYNAEIARQFGCGDRQFCEDWRMMPIRPEGEPLEVDQESEVTA